MLDVKEQVNKVGYAMANDGLKFEHEESGDEPAIVLGFDGGFCFERLLVIVAFDADGTGAQVSTSPIANVPSGRTDDVMHLLNDLNRRLRWARFYLNDDDNVIADCDVPFDGQCSGRGCVEAVKNIVQVVDITYPEIMATIWG